MTKKMLFIFLAILVAAGGAFWIRHKTLSDVFSIYKQGCTIIEHRYSNEEAALEFDMPEGMLACDRGADTFGRSVNIFTHKTFNSSAGGFGPQISINIGKQSPLKLLPTQPRVLSEENRVIGEKHWNTKKMKPEPCPLGLCPTFKEYTTTHNGFVYAISGRSINEGFIESIQFLPEKSPEEERS